MSKSLQELKAEILRLTREYSDLAHKANRPGVEGRSEFEAGKTVVPYAGRVFSADEVEAAVDSTLDFWLTLGPQGEKFEQELAAHLGVKYTILVNSGSSANLLALTALTSYKLPTRKRICLGDEVITVAAGFPTTIAPIIQNGAIPVFVDSNPITGNICADQLEAAYRNGRTKAVIIAHTLGNPFDIGIVLEFCQKYDLWLIEDNCDALGSTYAMPIGRAKQLGITASSPGIEAGDTHIVRYSGTWGDISTQSFYPPHHLTMGEGGAVNIVSKAQLKGLVESFRDWGRDCWCASGMDNTCGKRFNWQLGNLPSGYDHKYIYSHLGYNLKPLDLQAAIGRQQLKKLPAFIAARKENWKYLRSRLGEFDEFFDFSLPTHAAGWDGTDFSWDSSGCRTECSWFGFMLRVREGVKFTRPQLTQYLEKQRVGNRVLFGGNMVRQPALVNLAQERPTSFRTIGDLPGADAIMKSAVFIGVYPGLSEAMLAYQVATIQKFIGDFGR
jgi:CDP-4-dehydro-6-deoxyglucose reductase, E1